VNSNESFKENLGLIIDLCREFPTLESGNTMLTYCTSSNTPYGWGLSTWLYQCTIGLRPVMVDLPEQYVIDKFRSYMQN